MSICYNPNFWKNFSNALVQTQNYLIFSLRRLNNKEGTYKEGLAQLIAFENSVETSINNYALNILEEKTKGWKKRWVIVRRPYVFVFRDERDPCERALVNLATARTEYNCITPLGAGVKVPNSFSIVTNHRGYLIQVERLYTARILTEDI